MGFSVFAFKKAPIYANISGEIFQLNVCMGQVRSDNPDVKHAKKPIAIPRTNFYRYIQVLESPVKLEPNYK